MAYSNRLLVGSLSFASFLAFSASGLAQNAKPSGATTAEAAKDDSAARVQSESAAPASPEQAQPVADTSASASSAASAPTDAAQAPAAAGAGPASEADVPQQQPVSATSAAPAPTHASSANAAPSPEVTPGGETGRVHDGFYLRMALGSGTAKVKLKDAPEGLGYAMEPSGNLDLMAGGTPSPGMVLGGGLWVSGFSTEEWRGENRDEGSGVLFGVGPFIDYFPDPEGGFHLGGTVGIGGLQIDAEPFSDDKDRTATGNALGAWIGYDVWVSREWSLGVEARYLGVRAKHPEADWKGTADTFGLSLTGLYH